MNHHTLTDRVMNTLKRIFRPAAYWRDVYVEEDVERYHPEFGTFWQPKESGGLYLMQAQDEGYKLGYKDAVAHILKSDLVTFTQDGVNIKTRSEMEFRALILRGLDTSQHQVTFALQSMSQDGWDAIGMYHSKEPDNGYNRIVIGPNRDDILTVYFKRVKVSPSAR